MSVVRSGGGRVNGMKWKVLWPGFCSSLVMSIVVVYPRVACEFIRARETFFTTAEGAGERLLAGVCADVASLCGRLGWMRSC